MLLTGAGGGPCSAGGGGGRGCSSRRRPSSRLSVLSLCSSQEPKSERSFCCAAAQSAHTAVSAVSAPARIGHNPRCSPRLESAAAAAAAFPSGNAPVRLCPLRRSLPGAEPGSSVCSQGGGVGRGATARSCVLGRTSDRLTRGGNGARSYGTAISISASTQLRSVCL